MLLAIAMALLGAPGDLQVTNIEAGALVRYPVVILRGSAPTQEVVAGTTWRSVNRFPAPGGRFVALVELKRGMNMVLLASGPDVLKLRIDYRPMSTPYRVACIYLAPKDEPTDFDAPPGDKADQYGEKLDTLLKLLQSFTAESMNDAGFGRLTFPLEFDAKGRVIVHVVRSSHTGVELRTMSPEALWDTFSNQLDSEYPAATTKSFCVMSFSRYDPASGAVPGAASIAKDPMVLLGGQNMSVWPTCLKDVPDVFSDTTPIDPRFKFDDSDGRGTIWGLASRTMGTALHRLGQAFGVAETDDPTSIMSNGVDLLNRAFSVTEAPCRSHSGTLIFKAEEAARWDPASASVLSRSAWFRPDGP